LTIELRLPAGGPPANGDIRPVCRPGSTRIRTTARGARAPAGSLAALPEPGDETVVCDLAAVLFPRLDEGRLPDLYASRDHASAELLAARIASTTGSCSSGARS